MSSRKPDQLRTGLKALLSPVPREEGAPMQSHRDNAEHLDEVPQLELAKPAAVAASERIGTVPTVDAERVASSEDSLPAPNSSDSTHVTALPHSATHTAPRRRATKIANAAPSRIGTIDAPYVRQRDNRPTRKVGVILPVDVADDLQIHCVLTRQRPNEFIERAINAALSAESSARKRGR